MIITVMESYLQKRSDVLDFLRCESRREFFGKKVIFCFCPLRSFRPTGGGLNLLFPEFLRQGVAL